MKSAGGGMQLFGSIKFKIWLCVGVGFIGFFFATVSTFQSNARLFRNLSDLRDVTFPLSLKGEALSNTFIHQTSLYEDAFLLADEDALDEGNAETPVIQHALDEMVQLAQRGDGAVKKTHDDLLRLKKDYTTYALQAKNNYTRLVEGADITALQNEIRQLGQLQSNLNIAFKQLTTRFSEAVREDIAAGERTAQGNSTLILALFVVVGVATILVVNFASTRLLIRPIRSVQLLAARLADGDLTVVDSERINVRGEIGELVQTMSEMAANLRTMILDIHGSSDNLAAVSRRLLETAHRVEGTARVQVTSVDETSLAICKIGESVAEVTEQMERVSSTSEDITSSVLEQAASNEEIAQNIENLSESAEHVSSSIAEIAASIRQVSESVNGLKGEADGTASSVAQMEVSIREVMQAAKQTADIAGAVRTDAEAGESAVSANIEGMQRIKGSSRQASEAIKAFSAKTENIGEILSVIDNLADETNLLALNAAIIAAQAGEHGRGFAVVADQIKELADQTSHSTREIVIIIDGVREESRRAVAAIVEAEQSVTVGETLSLESGEALRKIVAGAQKAAAEVEKISRATHEQVQGSTHMRKAMDRVADTVGQIVGAIGEQEKGGQVIAKAAERVRDLAGQINLSTREQSRASRAVAAGMQDVNGNIQKVTAASDEQRAESDRIMTAVDHMLSSARDTLDATGVVNEAASALEQMVTTLQRAVGHFRNASEADTFRQS